MNGYGILKPADILKRLDAKAVLLPIKKGGKATSVKKWTSLDFAKTQGGTFQSRLTLAPAIAVSLGEPSEGICSIDFDDDDAHFEFIALNPKLKASLTTKGRRGCNIWLKMVGDYPRTKSLKRGSDPIGEWRATGGYTIITGVHPSGLDYRVIVDSPPLLLSFGEIVWPKSWNSKEVFSPSSLSPLSQDSLVSEGSIPSKGSIPSMTQGHESLRERLSQAEEAHKKLSKNADLLRLYERYVKRSFTPKQGSRNSSLIAMVTFLFHSVGRARLIELATAYHQINYDIFIDPLFQHMNEATAHLETLKSNYPLSLTPAELSIVQQLPTQHLETFRISRDLAKADSDESAKGTFFISHKDLGVRLDTSRSQAGRLIEGLISLKVFEVIEKGELYQKGRKPKATRYRWLLAQKEFTK